MTHITRSMMKIKINFVDTSSLPTVICSCQKNVPNPQACIICGMLGCCIPGTFFPQALLHDLRDFYTIYVIFTRFYTIFTQFFRDFYTILRDFCDFYAIFCQAKNLASQAPKTIMQACQGGTEMHRRDIKTQEGRGRYSSFNWSNRTKKSSCYAYFINYQF